MKCDCFTAFFLVSTHLGLVLDWSPSVQDWSGPMCGPGPVRTEDRTAVLLGPIRTAVPVPVLLFRGGPVRSSVPSPRKFTSRTGTGPDPATLSLACQREKLEACGALTDQQKRTWDLPAYGGSPSPFIEQEPWSSRAAGRTEDETSPI